MRVTLADSTLARQAGRFVWLELDYDKPVNRDFFAQHAVAYTPAVFVLDAASERATASHYGSMTMPELKQFLERGAQGFRREATAPADAALARGDELLGAGQLVQAAASYRRALECAPPRWSRRGHTVAQLTWTLMAHGDSPACAATAVAEAPHLTTDRNFGRVALAGLACANLGETAAWADSARQTLLPLAAAAVERPETGRDDRFQLYQQLMHAAELQEDNATLSRWGERWLTEIDAVVPKNDDERTALDVARVDAVSLLGTPERAITALVASEQAMPRNYNASLRLAQVETEAGRYDEALAACDRGLAHVDGPIGRTWLLQTKARAWIGKGDAAMARRTLEEAEQAANAIGTPANRDHNLQAIARLMAAAGSPAR